MTEPVPAENPAFKIKEYADGTFGVFEHSGEDHEYLLAGVVLKKYVVWTYKEWLPRHPSYEAAFTAISRSREISRRSLVRDTVVHEYPVD